MALSTAKCVLLAVHYATTANIDALRTLTPSRQDAFDPELVLRILLTYLPESIDPSNYTTYVSEVASRIYLEQREDVELDTSAVAELSESQARKRVKKLLLLPLAHSSCPDAISEDLLALFVVHRAHRIDEETGLLALVPQLVNPFIDRSPYLRTWFISVVLPLVRLEFEYYPDSPTTYTIEDFEKLQGAQGVDVLLGRVREPRAESADEQHGPARDIKGLVGPWMYGYNERKRRKLNKEEGTPLTSPMELSEGSKPRPEETGTGHDWEYVYAWIVRTAAHNFDVTTQAIEGWDGPGDVDLGGYEDHEEGLDEDTQQRLELEYAQSAFASVYAAEANTPKTIEGAHEILVRLADLLDYEPPPDLATSVDLLPRIGRQADVLHDTTATILQPDTLLRPGHPLTMPRHESFCLLQIFVYSAYLLAGVGHAISVVNVAKIRFHSDANEQLSMLQRILHTLVSIARKDDEQWQLIRERLLWLWHWGMERGEYDAEYGDGIFGKIGRKAIEKEILKAYLSTAHNQLAIKVYIDCEKPPKHNLSNSDIESTIIDSAMSFYDNASNGNRTRGGLKKASDLLSAFRSHFGQSQSFREAGALLAATHALSFYSLTLQHGVPFQPVNIRISKDPCSLLSKVLEQNPRSYTKLDDLISIAENLVAAGLPTPQNGDHEANLGTESDAETQQKKILAERRVMGMAIEAALKEDDFETAYSYVVNRLTPTTNTSDDPTTQHKNALDDVSWRAALNAGRYRGSLSSSNSGLGSSDLRFLEQRMELLSQALLLAPPSALPEVLTVWRRCEEEMTTQLAQENEAEERFNDTADKRTSLNTTIPGGFESNSFVPIAQPRREVGRGAAEEAPMGLFDVARGAAAAFSRSAFPLRGASGKPQPASATSPSSSMTFGHARNISSPVSETGSIRSLGSGDEASASQRLRKRDMVANAGAAATDALASGLGWMLGATPADREGR